MNAISFLSMLAAVVYLGMGVYVFFLNSRSVLNRSFAMLCLSLTLWSAAYTFFLSAADLAQAWFWYRMSSLGWCTTPVLIMLFLWSISHNKRFPKQTWIYPVLFLPAAVFVTHHWSGHLLAQDFHRSSLGWLEVLAFTPWSLAFDAYYLIMTGFGLAFIFRWGWATPNIMQHKQARLIFVSGLATVAMVTMANRILPYFGFYRTPGMAQFLILFWILSILYAMVRYRLMSISVISAVREIVASMIEGVVVLDLESKIQFSNEAASRILGASEKGLLARPVTEILLNCSFLGKNEIRQLLRHGPIKSLEFKYHRSDGMDTVIELSASNVNDHYGQPIGAVIIIRDITDIKEAEEKLLFMATHDPLTKVPNRILFNDRFQQALTRARRYNHTVALMLIDMDHLKSINDAFGHEIGDAVIVEFTRKILKVIRACDTIARLGGDEFGVVLTDLQEPAQAAVVAERTIKALAAPIAVGQNLVRATASIGISVFPTDADTAETLLKIADQSLYAAKDRGRNNYQFYLSFINQAHVEKTRFEQELREAAAGGSFELHYQPVFDLKDRKLSGVEALIRWRHPTLGLIQPMDFLPLAESTGLIVPIGEWAFRAACHQVRQWTALGHQPVLCALNVSFQQLQPDPLLRMIGSTLAETGIRPDLIALEITESTAMRDANRTIEIVNRLRETGICIIIDDFGAGYSSLQWLKELRIDAVKIDHLYIKHIADDYHYAAMIRAIIAFAHALGMQVIAEGVETQAQLDHLTVVSREITVFDPCDKIQGFLLGRPVPPEEFARRHFLSP